MCHLRTLAAIISGNPALRSPSNEAACWTPNVGSGSNSMTISHSVGTRVRFYPLASGLYRATCRQVNPPTPPADAESLQASLRHSRFAQPFDQVVAHFIVLVGHDPQRPRDRYPRLVHKQRCQLAARLWHAANLSQRRDDKGPDPEIMPAVELAEGSNGFVVAAELKQNFAAGFPIVGRGKGFARDA
jgi:hypothetical protein